MIWLVWRRQRAAIVFAAALLVAYVVFLSALALSGAVAPREGSPPYVVIVAQLVLLVLPGVLGVILGAGLFGRELERGTHVFALTQSVGRVRWWATGLLAVGVPGVVAIGGVTWFAGLVLDGAGTPFPLDTPSFDASGVLPAAHLLLAFSLASATGLVTRNALAAVAVALGLMLVAQVLLPTTGRFEFLAPLTFRGTVAEVQSAQLDDARVLYAREFGPDGRPVRAPVAPCPPGVDSVTCLRDSGIAEIEYVYQPQSRYAALQAIEAAILAGLAAVAVGAGWWGLRRRVW